MVTWTIVNIYNIARVAVILIDKRLSVVVEEKDLVHSINLCCQKQRIDIRERLQCPDQKQV